MTSANDQTPEVEPGTETQRASESPPAAQPDRTEDEPESFPADYVKQLREEAAAHRIKAAKADRLTAELLTATKQNAAGDLLRDVSDLADDPAFFDDDGVPVAERIRTAAEDLVTTKPWLARPRGDVGQGPRGVEPDTTSLGSILREAAQ